MTTMLSRTSWLSTLLLVLGIIFSLSVTAPLALNEDVASSGGPHYTPIEYNGGADGGGIGVGDMDVNHRRLDDLRGTPELSCQDTYQCLADEN